MMNVQHTLSGRILRKEVMRMDISFGEVLTFGILLIALLTYIDKQK